VVTVALSSAFVAVMLLGGSLVTTAMQAGAADTYAGADLVLTPEDPEAAAPETPDGASAVWPLLGDYTQLTSADGKHEVFASLRFDPPDGAEQPDLVDGSPATTAADVVVDQQTADTLGARVGDTVMIPAQWTGAEGDSALTISGIVPTSVGSMLLGAPVVHVNQANRSAFEIPDQAPRYLVSLEDGADADQVTAAFEKDHVTVTAAQDAIDEETRQAMAGFAFLGAVLAIFVVIALVTSAVVIANTFAVTLAQRARTLALLRTLGATLRQVTGTVIRENTAVGAIGAVIGTVLAHLLVLLVLLLLPALGVLPGVLPFPITPLSVLLPLVVGIVLTLLAGWGPVRAATRVAPLEAMRPSVPETSRGLGARGVFSIAAIVLGLVALAGAVAVTLSSGSGLGILLGVLGGVVSFAGAIGILLAITGPLARFIGRLVARIGGIPARVAAANTARNPRRSAATVAALLIGTTLMTMMAVGARTAQGTLESELDSRKPFDLVASARAFPDDAADRVASVAGIDREVTGRRGDVDVDSTEPMTLYALTPDQVRETANLPDLSERMQDGVVLLGQERAERFAVQDQQVLTVPGADGSSVQLRVEVVANLQMSLVTPATFDDLAVDDEQQALVASFDQPGTAERGDISALSILQDVSTALEGPDTADTLSVDGPGVERESNAQILSVLLGVTMGLLAVAVVVALVGVANTLSLGVIERSGENALLRALGTTRHQMRSMLSWEGVLLALIGSVLGILLGSVYGVLGIITLLGSTFPVSITIPWGQLALVLVLALGAGWAASVLPGRRAASAEPARALAGQED
jgi:putative ABC transport system permease protein